MVFIDVEVTYGLWGSWCPSLYGTCLLTVSVLGSVLGTVGRLLRDCV